MVKFSANMPTNEELRNNPTKILNLQCVSGEIVGWANHGNFISQKDNTPWFTFNKEDRLISGQVLPKSPSQLSDLKHLENYMRKVQTSKALESSYIGPNLDALVNVRLPIKWLNNELKKLLTM